MRLIDADAFRKVLSKHEMRYDGKRTIDEFAYGATSAYEHAGDLLDEMPTIKTFTLADIEEQYRKGLEKGLEETRPRGEWVFDKDGYFSCSCCKMKPHYQVATTYYCPNCGARME